MKHSYVLKLILFLTVTHTCYNIVSAQSDIVTSGKAMLRFAFSESPDTPVKEGWIATVTERNKAHSSIQQQKMTEAMLYEPGNYHIEINTFPKEIRNVDLSPGTETVVSISRPGFAKFIVAYDKISLSLIHI